ncbi:response regulator, partial [Candidatus Thorarchaeota archaeon]
GFEVCKRLRSHKDFKSIPILMFTARGFSSDLERGEEVGADEYIVKPFSGRALVATIKKHLNMAE